jgi:hypothetical protein
MARTQGIVFTEEDDVDDVQTQGHDSCKDWEIPKQAPNFLQDQLSLTNLRWSLERFVSGR